MPDPKPQVLSPKPLDLALVTQAREGAFYAHGASVVMNVLIPPPALRHGRCRACYDVRLQGQPRPYRLDTNPATVWFGYNAQNNPNRGFLSDMQCPFCDSYGPFYALITHWADVYDNEIRPEQLDIDDPDFKRRRKDQIAWSGDEDIICQACGYRRKYSHFHQGD